MVAAACNEVDRRRGEPVGDSPRAGAPAEAGTECGIGESPLDEDILDRMGRDGGDEGGREFRSGDMALMTAFCGSSGDPRGDGRRLALDCTLCSKGVKPARKAK